MKDTLSFLYSLRNQGSRFGIERMEALCGELKNPQLSYPCIHVAGTNGKGSVCTMLDAIYRAHGYRVGLFTSPHILELGERIRVNGKNLAFSKIEQWVEQLLPLLNHLENKEHGIGPTFFEFMTAIAFLEFQKQNVDLAIVETGLGGRLDSTNVMSPELSIITSVGFDHCEILGNQLIQIAAEKAGIIKQGTPVVVGWMEKEAKEQVCKIAKKKSAPVYLLEGQKQPGLPLTNLAGTFQRKNAALACKAVDLLKQKFPVEDYKVSNALLTVKFPGRWQKISTEPTIVLDACHNGHGAQASAELWDRLPAGFEVWFAACGQERASEVLPLLLKRTAGVTLFELNQPRSCRHHDLQKIVHNFAGSVTFAHEKQIPHLCEQLHSQTTLLVTGSIYLVAAVLGHLQKIHKSPATQDWQDRW